MATVNTLISDLVTAVGGLAETPTRLDSDYRDDLEAIAAGAARFQIQAAPVGQSPEDANQLYQIATVTLLVHRALGDAEAERTYTEGNMLTDLATLTTLSWWRGLASVHELVTLPEVEISRVGRVISYSIEVGVTLNP